MKYGFVYIWRDRKHKRFYIGCHWGSVEDNYICSSDWMKRSYKRRPTDFKRRIVCLVYTNRKDLFEEGAFWQSMIKDEEFRVKYYNIKRHGDGHWSTNPQKVLSISERASIQMKAQHQDPEYRKKYLLGRAQCLPVRMTPEIREKKRKSMLGKNVGMAKTQAFYDAIEARRGTFCNSEQHRAKTRERGTFKQLNSTITACIHCGVTGNVGNIARYHNTKCKTILAG